MIMSACFRPDQAKSLIKRGKMKIVYSWAEKTETRGYEEVIGSHDQSGIHTIRIDLSSLSLQLCEGLAAQKWYTLSRAYILLSLRDM